MSANPKTKAAYAVIRTLLSLNETRGEIDAAREVLESWRANGHPWTLLADEVEYHGVMPLLVRFFTALSTDVFPRDARRIFLALAKRHQYATAAREACVDDLLIAFAAAKLPMMLLKGAALAHRIYSAPHLRPSFDIDILIDHSDEPRAIELVCELGFSFTNGLSLAKRHHHLPTAMTARSGFPVFLEIHRDAMSPDQPYHLTWQTLTQCPQTIHRGIRPPALSFGHRDMLHHLTRHAFEPAHRIRLIHLYDIYYYSRQFHAEIDWPLLARTYPHVLVVLQLLDYIFDRPDRPNRDLHPLEGVGAGMVPLAQIAAANIGPVAKLSKLLNPPAWWLCGYYAVPPGRSLVICRALRHPATVTRWLGRRFLDGARNRIYASRLAA